MGAGGLAESGQDRRDLRDLRRRAPAVRGGPAHAGPGPAHGRPRGIAVVCTPPGEEHALPASMAAICLRSDRWQVHHLGTQVPVPDLVALVATVKADLLVLSRTREAPDGSVEAVRQGAGDAGARVLVGGPRRTLRQLLDLARGPLASPPWPIPPLRAPSS